MVRREYILLGSGCSVGVLFEFGFEGVGGFLGGVVWLVGCVGGLGEARRCHWGGAIGDGSVWVLLVTLGTVDFPLRAVELNLLFGYFW